MRNLLFFGLTYLLSIQMVGGQDLEILPLTDAWKKKIETLAPKQTRYPSSSPKKILLFSLHTGFEHWVIPHTSAVIEILASKTQQFDVVHSKDIKQFELENLVNYDVVVLNNTCSKPQYRNLFWDQLQTLTNEDSSLLMTKAQELEDNLYQYVNAGGGLLLLHGGITTLNNSKKFSELVGASFDYHPPQQTIHVKIENENHPLVKAFPKEGFIHVDEPYFYKNAYFDFNFTPILYFENSHIRNQKTSQTRSSGKTYLSWIRAEGKGKVMYIAPSHNAQTFENPAFLQFMLDGIQYVAGDVTCDETPLQK